VSGGFQPRTLTGTVLADRYTVCELLGEGGTSRIYAAEDEKLGRSVALKVLAPSCRGRPEHVHRLLREAYIGAKLAHVNVCAVSDIGELPTGDPFFVMERLVGESLQELIASKKQIAPSDAVAIIMQLLSALADAHDRGIIHRDIKPGNVFLVEARGLAPRVKLLDFGIAQVMRAASGIRASYLDDRRLTATGMVVGTPQYMAPEQANGQRDLDARVDVYASGVLLYEMLSGRRPFEGSSYVALMNKILHDRPRPLARLAPHVDPALVAIVEQAMATDRNRRYATASELLTALSSLRAPTDAEEDEDWNHSTVKTRADRRETVRRMPIAMGTSTLPAGPRRR
jgi:eukaryotic-like serine/threonine-protein kinase